MKRDKRGFTLVELLAVIVVLGLLMIIALPHIIDTITGSKNKLYVQDAKRLIGLAEYKMRANNIKIEKPDPGDCIVLSYTYLNDGSIKDAPNKGEYLDDASFVVVKNVGGNMEYSVSLIETDEDNTYFKGIRLALENELNSSNANEMVKSYKKSDLLYVSDDASIKYHGDASRVINKGLINQIRSNYIDDGDVVKIYVYDDLEQGTSSGSHGPSIVTVNAESKYVASTSSPKFVVDVSVVAVDSDNDNENELIMCIRPSVTADNKYPQSTDEVCVPYTSGTTIKKTFEYNVLNSLGNCDVGNTMYYYIRVFDPDRRFSSKSVTKNMQKNTPPVFNSVSVTKKSGEINNTHIVNVNVSAYDDFGNPTVCINQSTNTDNCVFNSYKKSYEYTIIGSDGKRLTKPDGKTYQIYVHLKDSCGSITTSEVQPYTVSELTDPVIEAFNFVPENINGIESLTGELNIAVSDTFTNNNNSLMTVIVEVDGTKIMEKTYAEYLAGSKTVTLPGKYDGKDRNIKLTVKSVYDREVTSTIVRPVYSNRPPTINYFTVSSQDDIQDCSNCYGSYNVSYELNVDDDLDSISDLEYCVGESSTTCNDYKSIVEKGYYTFDKGSNTKPYDGSEKKLYLFVRDKYPSTSTQSVDYTIYQNEKPEVSGGFSIEPFSEDGKENTISIIDEGINITDDFDNYGVNLCYTIDGESEDNVLCVNSEYKSYDELIDISNERGFILKDSSGEELNGKTVHLFIVAKDDYEEKGRSAEFEYVIPRNDEPVISDFDVKSAVVNDAVEDYGDKNVIVEFTITDPGDKYRICINESDSCSDFDDTVYDAEVEGEAVKRYIEYEGDWDIEDPNTNRNRTIYLHVKDKYGHIVSVHKEYKLYIKCAEIKENEELEIEGEEINKDTCGGKCYHIVEGTDLKNEISAKYSRTLSYTDKVFEDYECSAPEGASTSSEIIYHCDYYTCFGSNGDTVENAIGTTRRGNQVWTFNFVSREIVDNDESGDEEIGDEGSDGLENYDDESGDGDDNGSSSEERIVIKSIQCRGYYNRYRIEVKNGSLYARLIQDEEICPELADSGYSYYQFNGTDEHPYIRFNDSGYSG